MCSIRLSKDKLDRSETGCSEAFTSTSKATLPPTCSLILLIITPIFVWIKSWLVTFVLLTYVLRLFTWLITLTRSTSAVGVLIRLVTIIWSTTTFLGWFMLIALIWSSFTLGLTTRLWTNIWWLFRRGIGSTLIPWVSRALVLVFIVQRWIPVIFWSFTILSAFRFTWTIFFTAISFW